jgi:hypothetical protein
MVMLGLNELTTQAPGLLQSLIIIAAQEIMDPDAKPEPNGTFFPWRMTKPLLRHTSSSSSTASTVSNTSTASIQSYAKTQQQCNTSALTSQSNHR